MKNIIYKVTNQINGKIYIGRSKLGVKGRWKAHLSRLQTNLYGHLRFYRALKKYGPENFIIEQIEICDSFEESRLKEAELILFHESHLKEKGYNMCIDAARGIEILSEESLQRQALGIHRKSFALAKKENSNGLVGVNHPYKGSNSWRISVTFNKKTYSFSFSDKIEAAEFHDKYSVFRYGEDACLNFPEKYKDYESVDFFEIINDKLKNPTNYRKTNNINNPGIFFRKVHKRWGFSVVDLFSKKRHAEETFLSEDDALEAQKEFLEINDNYRLPAKGKEVPVLIPRNENKILEDEYISKINTYRNERSKYTGEIEDIKLSKDELKNEIWEKSLKVVASNYKMAAHKLKKHCVSQNIPLPPKGYYFKIRNSKLNLLNLPHS